MGARREVVGSNSANLSGAVTNPAGTLQIDTLAPTVTSVVSSGAGIDGSGNGDMSDGHAAALTAQVSDAVPLLLGTPKPALNNSRPTSSTRRSPRDAMCCHHTA